MDLFGTSRKKTVLINGIAIILLSLPCVFGFNIWSGFQPMGAGSTIQDLEDFIVSNNLLPLGSICCSVPADTAGAGKTSWQKPTPARA